MEVTRSYVFVLLRPSGGGAYGIILCIHAKANTDCCPRGQSHCVALCPGIVGLDKRSAGIKAEAKATGVVVVIVFVGIRVCLRITGPLLVLFVHWIVFACVCAGLRVFRPLAGLFFGMKFTCTDANDSWL